ncbi:Serine hydroxymethyltransferase 4 [Capsicum baccatum]|uniref:Serine hydroxymethyltransferase 4 n=1 Tax=Capsicum baccatum TaxID=33114 RepID=A0A2G2VJ64_CAPBA|nr:Serine hydroxymethyltransferase 4 [Capsicum baccatum]
MTPGFKAYAKQAKANVVALGNFLMSNKVEKLCYLANITINKNALFGDSFALAPGGVRIGTPTMTPIGFLQKDSEQIGEFLHRTVTITLNVQKEHGKASIYM